MVRADAAQTPVDGDDPASNEVRSNPADLAVELPLDLEPLRNAPCNYLNFLGRLDASPLAVIAAGYEAL